mmetsp:Transcript_24496/g.61415  ORF Transcript_24496/g.61415 Transcript_24496/m.61415 type:complete len:203 (+) Transcript_24496:1489-2097(+)
MKYCDSGRFISSSFTMRDCGSNASLNDELRKSEKPSSDSVPSAGPLKCRMMRTAVSGSNVSCCSIARNLIKSSVDRKSLPQPYLANRELTSGISRSSFTSRKNSSKSSMPFWLASTFWMSLPVVSAVAFRLRSASSARVSLCVSALLLGLNSFHFEMTKRYVSSSSVCSSSFTMEMIRMSPLKNRSQDSSSMATMSNVLLTP